MNKTKKKYEQYLNALLSDTYSMNQAVDNYSYFKGGKIRETSLISAHANRTLGTLLRRYDPICFQVGYNEWSRK